MLDVTLVGICFAMYALTLEADCGVLPVGEEYLAIEVGIPNLFVLETREVGLTPFPERHDGGVPESTKEGVLAPAVDDVDLAFPPIIDI